MENKIVTTLMATALLIVGFMFSVIALAAVAVLGLVGLGYFWWKTRALRRAIREQKVVTRSEQSTVIEGEATVVQEGSISGRSPLFVVTHDRRGPEAGRRFRRC